MAVGLPYRQGGQVNGRNMGKHTRMPSLPSNIKGSIGNISGGNPLPLNIAANDITYAGYQKGKFNPTGMSNSVSNGGVAAAHGQRLINLNLNGQGGSPPNGGQNGYNFMV